MDQKARERAVLPIAVPIGILGTIFVLVFGFSRILLNVPKPVAVAVALMTAVNILITCAVISIRKVRGATILGLVIVLAVPVVFGGAAAAKVIKVHVKVPAAAPPPPVDVTAANVAFSTKTITLYAPSATINFKNNDSVPHNIQIFNGSSASAPVLFNGTIAPPASSQTYQVTGLTPGTYFFHCIVHPSQMTGQVVVLAASAYGGGGASANTISLTAQNIAWQTPSLTATSGKPISINLINKDTSVPHNIAITSGPAGYTPDTTPPPVTPPGSSHTYTIPALQPGTYTFKCLIHPAQMIGTLTVQ